MIKFLGHASIYIKTDTTSLVTDPWFSKNGIFLNSWFQFPDNTDIDLSWKDELDYVCISHEHEDHFDIEFLKTLSSRTKIIIPEYKNKRFYNLLKKNLPRNLILQAPHKQKSLLGDIEFYPIIQNPGWDDCGMLFKVNEEVVFDLNDMKISDTQDIEWIKSNFDIDYLFMQFSGANWFPHVYPQYELKDKIEICKDRRINKFNNVINLFKSLEAKLLIPCAGPPCFLDDVHFDMNFMEENGFPTQKDFYNYYSDNVCILLPNDEISLDMNIDDINKQNLNNECFTDRFNYLTKYKNRRTDIIKSELKKLDYPSPWHGSESLYESMKDYFGEVIRYSNYFRTKISGKIMFITEHEEIVIDFKNRTITSGYEDDCLYTYEMESKFLRLILNGDLDWESFFLSMRFTAKRNPDKYNEFLMILFKYPFKSSLKRYELFNKSKELDETFTLTTDGKEYECQRYCPHAHGDLSQGKVVDGKLVCPLHNWKFNLSDGLCSHSNHRLKIKEVYNG